MAYPTAPVTRPFVCASPAISVSATSTATTAVALPVTSAGAGSIIRIVNEGPSIAFISLGSVIASTVATLPTTGGGTATCSPILPGEDASFTRDTKLETLISAICRAGGTAALTVQTGEGS